MLLITEFTTERGETYTVLQLLKRLRKAIVQIDGILYGHQERIEVLEIDVDKIKADIENIERQILEVITRVDTLENKVDIVEDTLRDVESNITAIESVLDDHTTDISNINNLITNINSDITDLSSIVANIPIVSPSNLNGYIKIDGVETPVFIGGGGGGGAGGGSELIHFIDQWSGTLGTKSYVIDLPDFEDYIELNYVFTVYMNGVGKRCTISHYTPYDSGTGEMMLQVAGVSKLNPPNDNDLNYYLVNCKILLIKDETNGKYTKIFNSLIINKTTADYANYINTIIDFDHSNYSNNYDKPKWLRIDIKTSLSNVDVTLYPFAIFANTDIGSGGSGGSTAIDNVYRTNTVSITNDDLNDYKNIWAFPIESGENDYFEYNAGYTISIDKIDSIFFQCTIMGKELNLGEIYVRGIRRGNVYIQTSLRGSIRKDGDNYFISSNIDVVVSNTNSSAAATDLTTEVLASLNAGRGGLGEKGVDDNIKFNLKLVGEGKEDTSMTLARGTLKIFNGVKDLI